MFGSAELTAILQQCWVHQAIRYSPPAIPIIHALEITVTRSRVQSRGILRMNRERMGVLWTAGNPITPCRPVIVAAYKRASFDRDMQTKWSCQVRKNRLDVMRLWTWWEGFGNFEAEALKIDDESHPRADYFAS